MGVFVSALLFASFTAGIWAICSANVSDYFSALICIGLAALWGLFALSGMIIALGTKRVRSETAAYAVDEAIQFLTQEGKGLERPEMADRIARLASECLATER